MTVWPNGSRTIPRVTSEYGIRTHPISGLRTMHIGIDLIGFPNNKAPFAGRIIFARYNGGAGNEIRVQAANGDTARIKHNARFLVSEGQDVAEGQDVGVMGTTGTSTGIHCHFECWINRNTSHTNPRTYMAASIPAGGIGAPMPVDPPEPPAPTRRNTMTTLYYDRDSNGGNPRGATFALAGDGAGAAAWQEITDYDYASNLAHVHGRAVPLSAATFQIRKQQYLSPAPVRLIT